MIFYLDPKSRHPVYLQLANQVKQKIASRQIKAGDKLPTVHELSVQLVINANTVHKAYNELTNEGLIYSRRGQGVFVAEIQSTLNEKVRHQKVKEVFELFLTEAFLLGFQKKEIRKIMEDGLKNFDKESKKDE